MHSILEKKGKPLMISSYQGLMISLLGKIFGTSEYLKIYFNLTSSKHWIDGVKKLSATEKIRIWSLLGRDSERRKCSNLVARFYLLVEKSALHGMAIPEQETPLLSPFTVSKISRAKGISCLADITTDICTKAKVALWKSCHWRATLTNFCSEGFFF